MKSRITKVWWANLLPEEFLERQKACPVVYLPMGLVEPHGHISAFGLDTIKAEYICEHAANQVGGIVAPTQAYHIHETGYHAPWLEEVLGERNPYMASVPPHVLLQMYLFQLRAFINAGFKAVITLSGHAGGNQKDLQSVADTLAKRRDIKVIAHADPELVEGTYEGDHAGKYEISQLLYLNPELIDLSRVDRQKTDDHLGRFAIGDDAIEATAELGKDIMDLCVSDLAKKTEAVIGTGLAKEIEPISIEETMDVWDEVLSNNKNWVTHNPLDSQKPVSKDSKWKPFEKMEL